MLAQDFYGNYMSTEALAQELNTPATENFYFTEFEDYDVGGQRVGVFKALAPFSYVRFEGA